MESGRGVGSGAPPRRSRPPGGGGDWLLPCQMVLDPAGPTPGPALPSGGPPRAAAAPLSALAGTALPRCQIETPSRLTEWRGQAPPESSWAPGSGAASEVTGSVEAPGSVETPGSVEGPGSVDAPEVGCIACAAAAGGTASERPLSWMSELSEASGSAALTSVNPRAARESVKGRDGWLLSGGSTAGGPSAWRLGAQGGAWPAEARPRQGTTPPPGGPGGSGGRGGRGGRMSSGPIRPSCWRKAGTALSGTWTRPSAPKRSVSSRRYSRPARQRSQPTRWASTSERRAASISPSR